MNSPLPSLVRPVVAAAVDAGEDIDTDRMRFVYERLEEIDAATAPARAAQILSGLQFDPEMQAKATREFSGI